MKSEQEKLAILGGTPTVTREWPAYPAIDHEEVNAATEVLLSRQLSDCGAGPVVTRMEQSYAEYFGARYAQSFSSGTAAIHAALFAVGVKPGTEVLTCAHNWISGIMAILHAGGTPVLCDTARRAFHIDPHEIRRKAGPHTRAVVVTHLWGIPADMDPIVKLCRARKLALIEDVSHSHGAKYKGRSCGTIGDAGAFSLQGSKAITCGEGGFLLTDSKLYRQRSQVPGHHGIRLGTAMTLPSVKPFAQGGGSWTYRIPPLAAAVATAQLRKLPGLNAARQENFDRLRAGLRSLRFLSWPPVARESVRGWYSTPAFFDETAAGISRDTFVRACQAEGVHVSGEGYQDWSRIPLLQDLKLFRQMFVAEHANGVAFRPAPEGSFPNYDWVRSHMLLFAIPAASCPRLIDEQTAAIRKVAGQLRALRTLERKEKRA